MTPDELKNNWQNIGSGSRRRLDRKEIDRITSGRLTGARERLARIYFRMFAIMAPFGIVAILFNLLEGMIPLWMFWAFFVFFIVAGGMDLWLWRGIRSIDINRMGVTEVAYLARYYRRWHFRFQLMLIPVAVLLVTLFSQEVLDGDISILYGIIFGAIVGLGIGIAIFVRILGEYKELMTE